MKKLPIAEQGDARAQVVLGVMYDKGEGVPQDYIQAHKWFNIFGAKEKENIEKLPDILKNYMTIDKDQFVFPLNLKRKLKAIVIDKV